MVKTQSKWEEYYSTLKRIPKRLEKTAKFIGDAISGFQSCSVEKLVDLDCGAGRHSVSLARSGFEVIGKKTRTAATSQEISSAL